MFHPIYGKSLKPFVPRLKRLQDVLGDFQDACVATQRLRRYGDSVLLQTKSRGELIALGQLIAAQLRRAADRRAHFREVWKRFDRKNARKRVLAALK
jgi:CHAD domain-containing protein